jgi:hypothetical protein
LSIQKFGCENYFLVSLPSVAKSGKVLHKNPKLPPRKLQKGRVKGVGIWVESKQVYFEVPGRGM